MATLSFISDTFQSTLYWNLCIYSNIESPELYIIIDSMKLDTVPFHFRSNGIVIEKDEFLLESDFHAQKIRISTNILCAITNNHCRELIFSNITKSLFNYEFSIKFINTWNHLHVAVFCTVDWAIFKNIQNLNSNDSYIKYRIQGILKLK